jgi:hypothetical protein
MRCADIVFGVNATSSEQLDGVPTSPQRGGGQDEASLPHVPSLGVGDSSWWRVRFAL